MLSITDSLKLNLLKAISKMWRKKKNGKPKAKWMWLSVLVLILFISFVN